MVPAINDVLEVIEAFKKDMRELGVPVLVSVWPTPSGVGSAAVNLRLLVGTRPQLPVHEIRHN